MTNIEKKLSAKKAVTKKNFSALMKFESNDFGNAQRFLKFCSKKALYDSMSFSWFLYGEGRWKPDNDKKERVHKLANDLYSLLLEGLQKEYQDLETYGIDVLESNIADIASIEVEEDELIRIRERFKQCLRDRQIVLKLGNHSFQNRIIKSAEAQLVDEMIELNPYNHYLVVKNGVVDLRTGELLDHSPEHYSTMRAPVAFNPEAETPVRFLRFLDEIFDGNKSLIAYVQRLLGYCLTGNTTQQEFYILYGEGGNGKNVLIDLVKDILGEYAAEASAGALAKRTDGDKPNPTLLQAKDCRILIANESEKDAQVNDLLIKQISAGNEICPRALRKDNEHIVPHMKILWVTNHIPKFDWNDYAIERRIQLIPFSVIIPKEKRDKHLPKTLWEEREGVFKWLIDGARAYYEADGLDPIPEVMEEAKNKAKYGSDSIYGFFKNVVVATGDKASKIKARRVYTAYKQYCAENGINMPSTETMFGKRFQDLIKNTSIKKTKCSDGMYYLGLKLISKNTEADKVAATA